MAKRYRRKLLLVALEAQVGTAAARAAADAVLATNIEVTPVESETVSRELERPYYGGQPEVNVNVRAQIAFAVEMAGSGTPGTAPGVGRLLQACGMAEALTAALPSAYKAAAIYNTGDQVTFRGVYYQSKVDNNQGNAPPSAQHWEEIPDPRKAAYTPVTGGEKSVTVRINIDGVEQVLAGCRGTWTLNFGTGAIPRLAFTFTGKYALPTDTAALANPDLSAFRAAVIPSNDATPTFELLGVATLALSEMTLDWGAEVVQDERVGEASVAEIVDRAPSGQLTLDVPTVADLAIVDRAKAGAQGAFRLVHGTAAGDIVQIDMPKIQLASPSYQDRNGTWQAQMNYAALPQDGNDEIVITAR